MSPIYAVVLQSLLVCWAVTAMILHFMGSLPGDPLTTYIGTPVTIGCTLLIAYTTKRGKK